jgi:anti-sigma B factor antagonist
MEQTVRIEIDQRGGLVVARIAGEVDISNVADVRRQLTACVSNSSLGLVVDLSETSYLDSSGLHVLYDLATALKQRRQRVRLVAPEGTASERVLLLTGFDKAIPISSTVAAAVEEISAELRMGTESRAS